jgi:hypothetical protein
MTSPSARPDPVRNINTLSCDVMTDFDQMVYAASKIEAPYSAEYRKGFTDGIRALSMRFLKDMEQGKLDYEKVNR